MRLLVSVRVRAEAALAVEGRRRHRGCQGAGARVARALWRSGASRTSSGRLPSRHAPRASRWATAALPDELADVLRSPLATTGARGRDLPQGRICRSVATRTRSRTSFAGSVGGGRDLGPAGLAVVAVAYADYVGPGACRPPRIPDARRGCRCRRGCCSTPGPRTARPASPGCRRATALAHGCAGPVRRAAHRTRREHHRGRHSRSLWALQPDIVGVRGAACEGRAGILGPAAASRVRATLDGVAFRLSRPHLRHGESPDRRLRYSAAAPTP